MDYQRKVTKKKEEERDDSDGDTGRGKVREGGGKQGDGG